MNIYYNPLARSLSIMSVQEYVVSFTEDSTSFLDRYYPKKMCIGVYKNSHKEIGYINYIRRKNKSPC